MYDFIIVNFFVFFIYKKCIDNLNRKNSVGTDIIKKNSNRISLEKFVDIVYPSFCFEGFSAITTAHSVSQNIANDIKRSHLVLFSDEIETSRTAMESRQMAWYAPKHITYEDVSNKMSLETFNYLNSLFDGNHVICVKKVHSRDLPSMYVNGINLNGHYMQGDSDWVSKLQRQDVYARSNNQLSYLKMLQDHGFSEDIYGLTRLFNSNADLFRVLQELDGFSCFYLSDSVYFNVSNLDELILLISGASSGKSEGGNFVDGAVILKLPLNATEAVYIGDPILKGQAMKPDFIESFIPVSPEGIFGDVAFKNETISAKMSGKQLLTSMNNIINSMSQHSDMTTADAVKWLGSYLKRGSDDIIPGVGSVSLTPQQMKIGLDLYKGSISFESTSIVFDTINEWGRNQGIDNYMARILNGIDKHGVDYILPYVTTDNGARSAIRLMTPEQVRVAYDLYTGNISPETIRIVFSTMDKFGIEHNKSNYSDIVINQIRIKGKESAVGGVPRENFARDFVRTFDIEHLINFQQLYLSEKPRLKL